MTRIFKKRLLKKFIKVSIVTSVFLVAATIVLGILSYFYFASDLPSIEALKTYNPPAVTKFFAENGEIIGEFFTEKRELISLDRMPIHLVQAFVASEDTRFFQHKGLDYIAIFRALLRNVFSGEIVQGGSTITQQVVKSILLSPEKRFSRKIREALLAYRIEKYLSKEEILHLYLNQIYLGHGAYGVSAAAESYFGKSVEELTLAESSMLAGLPQAPSKMSPYTHPDQARRRQSYVLNRMVEEGFISDKELQEALKTPIRIISKQVPSLEKAPHFVEQVRKYIEEKYGKEALYQGGLQVYTTVGLEAQRMAQEAVESGLKEIEKRQNSSVSVTTSDLQGTLKGALEGALISVDLETGYVRAMVGGRDFKKSQFNRAIQAKRQTGSAFKPIVYASALDKGYTPTTLIVDSPLVFRWGDKTWKPKNFENRFNGPITLRNALTHSINTVTVRIAQDIGVEYIRDYAKHLGISSPLHSDLSMALGSSSLSLFELTKAYAVFANHGKAFRPVFIKKILDRSGNLMEENLPLFYPREAGDDEQIISPQTAYMMTHLLEGVVQHGTGWRAKALGRPVAAKTGTTDQFYDAWFVGYTPETLTGVWVGFDDERSIGENETGSRAASPIWVAFMTRSLKDRPVIDFPVPEGIEFMRVEPRTGEISSHKQAILECFKDGTGPTRGASPPVKTATDFYKLDFNLTPKIN
jgi:penicillin-binding protein 1A